MDYSGFSGKQKPVTWIRTPLHDRQHKHDQTRKGENGRLESSDEEKGFLSAGNSPTALIRDLSEKFFPKKKPAANRTVSFMEPVEAAAAPNRKISGLGRRDRRRWNAMNFLVGGQHFQSPEWIFDNHPHTLLGDVERRKLYYHKKRSSYEFPETLPDVFISLLEYYRTSTLTRPDRMTLNFFLEQLEVFSLEKEAVASLLDREGVQRRRARDHEIYPCKENSLRNKIWNILDNPQFSVTAKVYSFISLFVTALSVTLFVIETLPELRAYSLAGKKSLKTAYRSPIFVINTACFVFFVVELILRLATCPRRKAFLRSWTNWTDFLSIIPFVVTFIVLGSSNSRHNVQSISVVTAIRACRLLLLTRLFGTSRHHRQQWIIILAKTLWNNFETLFVLFFLMIICMIGFGGVLYAFEGAGATDPTYPTIPWGMWMAIETLTTVGYGDVVPKKALGQITAIFCGCVGLMFVGFVLESVTYEYHRLMKANSQYRRYLHDKETREKTGGKLVKVSTVHTGLHHLAAHSDDIHISINGADFYLSLAEINRHPNSLLGHPCRRSHYYNPNTGSYFFPRNQDIFPSIHHYYRCPGSVLMRPPFVTLQQFVEEIEFFQLPPQAVIDSFANEGIRLVEEEQPKHPTCYYWYLVLEHPRYNFLARVIMIISLFCTGLFVLNIVLESLPSLLDFSCSTALSNFVVDSSDSDTAVSNKTSGQNTSVSIKHDGAAAGACPNEIGFFVIETICTLWFFLELMARFGVAPSKRAFLRRPMNWVDLIIILPYICTLVQFVSKTDDDKNDRLFGFFRTMRLLRLISIVKFSRYFRKIRMIFDILQSTWVELLMLCYFMLINAIIFGTIMYLIEINGEKGEEADFNSIPRSMYWAWITMLTIGYGDMVPATVLGKVWAAGVSILGIVFWTLPMTLISDHFANFRRLYEGQDYLMLCLTRMYHLVAASESINETRKISTGKMNGCLSVHMPDQSTETTLITADSSHSNGGLEKLGGGGKRLSLANIGPVRSASKLDLKTHFQTSPKMTRRLSRMTVDGVEMIVMPTVASRLNTMADIAEVDSRRASFY